ncbi:MAG: antitoxin [Deltaproteobacteria bacterium]|nr:antitoxin [Deltaproteobacteria bacterium]
MQTKLTLRLEKQLVDLAKEYASAQGKSVSKMVADYFMLLNKSLETQNDEISPITKSLRGSLGKVQVDESDYKKHLEKKYL